MTMPICNTVKVQIKADPARCATFQWIIVANINMLHMVPHNKKMDITLNNGMLTLINEKSCWEAYENYVRMDSWNEKSGMSWHVAQGGWRMKQPQSGKAIQKKVSVLDSEPKV